MSQARRRFVAAGAAVVTGLSGLALVPATASGASGGPSAGPAAGAYQLACSGLPSAYPEALCTPTTARSANSGREAAPA